MNDSTHQHFLGDRGYNYTKEHAHRTVTVFAHCMALYSSLPRHYGVKEWHSAASFEWYEVEQLYIAPSWPLTRGHIQKNICETTSIMLLLRNPVEEKNGVPPQRRLRAVGVTQRRSVGASRIHGRLHGKHENLACAGILSPSVKWSPPSQRSARKDDAEETDLPLLVRAPLFASVPSRSRRPVTRRLGGESSHDITRTRTQ